MNVFILSAGRSGSQTFARASAHITNYTSAHESRSGYLGESHFDYPDKHIESDNRLSWLLGRLDRRFGDRAFYVHLTRAVKPVAASWVKRSYTGMMNAYRLFLRDKKHWMRFRLEEGRASFLDFWRRVGAESNLEAALAELDVRHNAAWQNQPDTGPGALSAFGSKLYRIGRKLPVFLRNA